MTEAKYFRINHVFGHLIGWFKSVISLKFLFGPVLDRNRTQLHRFDMDWKCEYKFVCWDRWHEELFGACWRHVTIRLRVITNWWQGMFGEEIYRASAKNGWNNWKSVMPNLSCWKLSNSKYNIEPISFSTKRFNLKMYYFFALWCRTSHKKAFQNVFNWTLGHVTQFVKP